MPPPSSEAAQTSLRQCFQMALAAPGPTSTPPPESEEWSAEEPAQYSLADPFARINPPPPEVFKGCLRVKTGITRASTVLWGTYFGRDLAGYPIRPLHKLLLCRVFVKSGIGIHIIFRIDRNLSPGPQVNPRSEPIHCSLVHTVLQVRTPEPSSSMPRTSCLGRPFPGALVMSALVGQTSHSRSVSVWRAGVQFGRTPPSTPSRIGLWTSSLSAVGSLSLCPHSTHGRRPGPASLGA